MCIMLLQKSFQQGKLVKKRVSEGNPVSKLQEEPTPAPLDSLENMPLIPLGGLCLLHSMFASPLNI